MTLPIDLMVTASATALLPDYSSFMDVFKEPALAVVAAGGVIGGSLQPVVAKFLPGASAAPTRFGFLMSPALGIAAAGISVFVIAHTDTAKGLPLFFFSMLCGLGFPVVLSQAVGSLGKTTAAATREVSKIADQANSNDPLVVAAATTQLREAMVKTPATTVTEDGANKIAESASRAVANIAQTAQAAPAEARSIVDQLVAVATVAQSAGYDATTAEVAKQLEMLSKDKNVPDVDAKKVAGEAADRFKVT